MCHADLFTAQVHTARKTVGSRRSRRASATAAAAAAVAAVQAAESGVRLL
jgi:hypothetical protein